MADYKTEKYAKQSGIPASAITSGTFAAARIARSDIVDAGTEGTKVAVGTTGQRGSTTGQFRFNSTTGKFEGKDATTWAEIPISPAVASVDDTEVDSAAGGNQTFVITGSNFSTGDVASFVGNDATEITASTTTIDSATQITAVIAKSSFVNSKEPYDIKIKKLTQTIGTLENQINVDNAPAWQTSAGNLGTIQDDDTGTHFTLVASDAEGDTVAYTETGGTNISGAGMALNSSTGVISGDPTDVNSATTVSFTARATAASKTADRAFNIIVNPAAQLTINSTGHDFSSSGNTASITTTGYNTITVSQNMSVYVDLWGAGGGAPNSCDNASHGGAGGMAYGQITLLNGTTYIAIVGKGGTNGSVSLTKFPDNGEHNLSQSSKAHGGGSTRFGLYTQSGFNLTNSASNYNNSSAVYQLIAGAGGGGAIYAAWSGTLGMYGGGTSGAAGGGYYHADGSSAPGGGGSQSGGGSGGTGGRSTAGGAGGKYSGGTSGAGAGGGGWFGGGGACLHYAAGGGGSGYLNTGGLLSNTGFQTTSAGGSNYYVSPTGTRSNKPSTAGNGGLCTVNSGQAAHGAIIFTKV
tara:strand:+ start:42 stop:1778 length:1737 start_codon:yes stop_codon:yes gene_type:complete